MAPAIASERLASLFVSSLEEVLSSASLHQQNNPSTAPVETTTVVVEIFIFTAATALSSIFKVSELAKIAYRADGVNADYSIQSVVFTDPDHVKKMPLMVRGSSWSSDFSSFSVAERGHPSDRLADLFPVVYGKLAVSLYHVQCCRRHAVSSTVDDFAIDWASFAQRSLVRFQFITKTISVTIKDKILISQMLKGKRSAGCLFFLSPHDHRLWLLPPSSLRMRTADCLPYVCHQAFQEHSVAQPGGEQKRSSSILSQHRFHLSCF